ncbi:unnamed protein product [Parnassius mnemosyne]|uniref:Uncharacterized protein n=1 Tax=Parnassius mnemosyne TaxID=213953 RepID=A0AAV1KZJ5_9NEOP
MHCTTSVTQVLEQPENSSLENSFGLQYKWMLATGRSNAFNAKNANAIWTTSNTACSTSLSASQLTFGCSIRLPCDFFTSTSSNNQEMNYDFVTQLRESINKVLSSKRTSSHGNNKSVFIHQELKTCKQVFVRNDAVKKQFQPTHDGPYKVLERNSKTFKLQIPGRKSTIILIDRLKPAYIINEDASEDSPSSSSSQPPARQLENPSSTSTQVKPILKTTRHGRIVKPPVRFR